MFPFPNLDSVPRIEKHIGMPDKLLQQYLVKPLCQVRCSEACNKQITMADPKRALRGAYRFSFLMTLTIDSGFASQKLTMSYS